MPYSRNPTASIYGTVLADSVLAAESERQTTLLDLIYAELVSVITAHGLFQERTQQGQDGSSLVVLSPMPPQ